MRIVLCDDEARYRSQIHERIWLDAFARDYEVEVTECSSGGELLEALDGGLSADVFFPDIQMEQGVDEGDPAGQGAAQKGAAGTDRLCDGLYGLCAHRI